MNTSISQMRTWGPERLHEFSKVMQPASSGWRERNSAVGLHDLRLLSFSLLMAAKEQWTLPSLFLVNGSFSNSPFPNPALIQGAAGI